MRPGAAEPVPYETIRDTVMAVVSGAVDWAIVPIENSLDGSVTVTLDLLADHADEVQIVGEALLAVRHCLIAATQLRLEEIEEVLTHPQVPGQCRRFLREQLPGARVLAASSTADAVRQVAGGKAQAGAVRKAAPAARREREAERGASAEPSPEAGVRRAAIGTRLAAELYGGSILRESIEDRDDNLTRFVWIGPAGTRRTPPLAAADAGERATARKTSLVFWGAGADRPGWLVLCLGEFAERSLNLTRIESRPRRERMGHYMFFVDLEGPIDSPEVAAALSGLRALCEEVRVLGSFPAARPLGG